MVEPLQQVRLKVCDTQPGGGGIRTLSYDITSGRVHLDEGVRDGSVRQPTPVDRDDRSAHLSVTHPGGHAHP